MDRLVNDHSSSISDLLHSFDARKYLLYLYSRCRMTLSIDVFFRYFSGFFHFSNRAWEKFSNFSFPFFEREDSILVSRSLVHAFDYFWFQNLKFIWFIKIFTVIIVIYDLASCSSTALACARHNSIFCVMYGDFFSSICDYFIDTLAEVVWYFFETHKYY